MVTHTLNNLKIFFVLLITFFAVSYFAQTKDTISPHLLAVEIHKMVNEERAKESLPPLQWDEKLSYLARLHSEDMASKNYLSHINSDGEDPSQRGEKLGIKCGKNYGDEVKIGIGENILQNALYKESEEKSGKLIYELRTISEIAKSTVNSWMMTNYNKENILDKEYVSEGIGVAISKDGKIFITEDLCIGYITLDENKNIDVNIDSLKKRIHNLVNLERTKKGLKTLSYSDALEKVAKSHSEDMAKNNFFSHTNLKGENPTKRAVKMGLPIQKQRGEIIFKGIGENIFLNHTYKSVLLIDNKNFYDYNSEEEIAKSTVEGWMKSKGHRENILNRDYDEEGIGIFVTEKGDIYITENFF